MKTLLRKIRNRLFASERLLLYRHETYIPQSSPSEIVLANRDNLNDLSYFDSQEKIEKYESFLVRGDRGYLTFMDGKCVHRSWVVCKPGLVLLHWSLPFLLKQNETYIHFCETAPQARGKNIFSHVLSRISEDFKGYDNVYICVNEENRASIRSIEKSGYVVSKRYRIIAVLNKLIYKKEDE